MNPSADLAAFIEKVAADPALLEHLAREESTEPFAVACAQLAQNLELRVEAAEVRALLQQRALIWQQRHVL